MSTIGFILFLVGAFKQDKRFFVAGGICIGFDVFTIIMYLVVMSVVKTINPALLG